MNSHWRFGDVGASFFSLIAKGGLGSMVFPRPRISNIHSILLGLWHTLTLKCFCAFAFLRIRFKLN